MEKLFEIFAQLTKVRLPYFIEKFINKELSDEYEYSYFQENPEEDINHLSICFNLEQIDALLKNMDKLKDKIFISTKSIGLKKTLEKLLSKNSQELLKHILNMEKLDNDIQTKNQKTKKRDKNKEEKEKEIEKVKLHFFLITKLLTNERYKELFSIEQKTANFSIKELKTNPNEESEQNNIIKVKNFFCSLLYNCNKLIKTDFNEGTTEKTEDILKELNKFMKSSNFVVDETIPSEWYVQSLLEYLKKIPKHLTDNEYEQLYNEIEKDVNNSIKELDIVALSVIMGKLKFAKRGKNYYEESRKLYSS